MGVDKKYEKYKKNIHWRKNKVRNTPFFSLYKKAEIFTKTISSSLFQKGCFFSMISSKKSNEFFLEQLLSSFWFGLTFYAIRSLFGYFFNNPLLLFFIVKDFKRKKITLSFSSLYKKYRLVFCFKNIKIL